MIPALALIGALATLQEAPPPAVAVRAIPRPEIPWVVAVAAVFDDVPADAAAAAKGSARAPLLQAVLDAGGNVAVEHRPDGALIVVEGPPDARAAVVATARAFVAPGRGALFVENGGVVDQGALPPLPGQRLAPLAPVPPVPHAVVQALAPSSALLDVEGAALLAFVESALPAGHHARLAFRRGAAALVIERDDGAADVSALKAAVQELVAAPLALRVVEALRVRAAGSVAHRRSVAGTAAHDAALLFLLFGSTDVDDAGSELGNHLRARLFPELWRAP